MNHSTEILFSIGQILSVFSTLILLIAAIILVAKKQTLSAWIILIGNVLMIISYTVGLMVNVFASRNGVDTLLSAQGISSIVQNLSYLIFSIGLIMLAITEFSKNKPLNSN